MNEQGREEKITHCVGRFCLEVPASMSRVRESYEQAETQLCEEPLVSEPKGAFERAWLGHLAQVEGLKKNRNRPGDIQGEIVERRPLPPNLESVVFHRSAVRKLVRLGALLDAGSVALWLETEGSPEFLDNLRSCVKEVAADYRLPEKDQKWPVPGQDWFYMRFGALATPSKYDEKAHVAFEGHSLQVTLEIETNTTDEPPPGLFERFTQTMAKAVGNAVAGVSPLRKGKRKVAGLVGEELLIRDSEGGKLSFLWSFPGEQGSAKHPEINVVMDTADGELDQKAALWESLLDSMRPVAP